MILNIRHALILMSLVFVAGCSSLKNPHLMPAGYTYHQNTYNSPTGPEMSVLDSVIAKPKAQTPLAKTTVQCEMCAVNNEPYQDTYTSPYPSQHVTSKNSHADHGYDYSVSHYPTPLVRTR